VSGYGLLLLKLLRCACSTFLSIISQLFYVLRHVLLDGMCVWCCGVCNVGVLWLYWHL